MKKTLNVLSLIALIVVALMLRDIDPDYHPKHHVETCEGNHQ